jgi:hypothetical protein
MDRWGGEPVGEEAKTIGQRINNTAVCSVPSPSNSKGRCFVGGGRGGVRWWRHIFSH